MRMTLFNIVVLSLRSHQSQTASNLCRKNVKLLICSCRDYGLTNRNQTNNAQNDSYTLKGKYLNKFVNKGGKSKRKWYQSHLASTNEMPFKAGNVKKKSGNQTQTRKGRQLSRILYDKIVEIIGTGELSDELLLKQVFISQVKMHNSFHGVNVYWDADRADAEEVEQLLFSVSGKLRSLLISYHVFGRIPQITFVREKKHSLSEILSLLDKADYGPDYKPGSGLANAENNEGDDSFFGDTVKEKLVNKNKKKDKYNETESHLANSEDNKEESVSDVERDKFFEDVNLSNNDPDSTSKFRYNLLGRYDSKEKQLNDEINAYFQSEGLHFENNMYKLPRDALMNKLLAKKHQNGRKEIQPFIADNLVNRMANLSIVKQQNKDKVNTNTKLKQRMLERDYDLDENY